MNWYNELAAERRALIKRNQAAIAPLQEFHDQLKRAIAGREFVHAGTSAEADLLRLVGEQRARERATIVRLRVLLAHVLGAAEEWFEDDPDPLVIEAKQEASRG